MLKFVLIQAILAREKLFENAGILLLEERGKFLIYDQLWKSFKIILKLRGLRRYAEVFYSKNHPINI